MCASLDAVASDVLQVAAEFENRARSMSAAAMNIRSIGQGSDDPYRLSGLADQLNAAGQSCQRAAMILREAHQTARTYTQGLYSGGGATMSSGRSSPSGGGGQELPGQLQSIYDDSFPTPDGRGRFFLDPGDEFRLVANTMPPTADGTYLAMVHGSTTFVGAGGCNLTPEEFATLIREDPAYSKGTPVVLFSCMTGATSDGFAAQLATVLGVPVYAPTDLAWLPPDRNGVPVVSPRSSTGGPMRRPDGSGYGCWAWHQPEGGTAS